MAEVLFSLFLALLPQVGVVGASLRRGRFDLLLPRDFAVPEESGPISCEQRNDGIPLLPGPR